MSIKETMLMYATGKTIINETIMNKGIAKSIASNELANKLRLLDIEYSKRYKQLIDDYTTEKKNFIFSIKRKLAT